MESTTVTLDPVIRLKKDIIKAGQLMTLDEIRYLVDNYYTIQDNRKAASQQYKALEQAGEPNEIIKWLAEQNQTLEEQIKKALDNWSSAQPVSIWSKSITGIGPVLASGLQAHIDITKAPTAGHIWSYAGIIGTNQKPWEKGQKRPWNADLKTLCWLIGESFVKVCNNDKDVYGKLYTNRKAIETVNNEQLKYKDQAEAKLAKFKIGKTTDAYASYSIGKLPPAHIHSRAKRYAVKIFLSHWQQVAYFIHYGVRATKPFVIEHLGHVHELPIPNMDMVPGMLKAYGL